MNGATPELERQTVSQRLASHLTQTSGDDEVTQRPRREGASLEEVRGALSTGPLRHFVVAGGECGACGRRQALLVALPDGRPVE